MARKVLITGASGMLGSNLAWCWRHDFEVHGLYYAHPVTLSGVFMHPVNLLDFDAVHSLVKRVQPDVVVHCAAATQLDKQEAAPEYAKLANVEATRNLVSSLKGKATRLVHISTDAVYGGKQGPHRETDICAPLSIYGKTKYTAEQEALILNRALVLRTTIYGWSPVHPNTLGEWFLRRIQAKEETPGFADVTFSAIYTMDLAGCITHALERGLEGIFNAACHDTCSKFDFGRRMAELLLCNPALITRASINSSPAVKAPRAKDMRLCVDSLERALGQRMPSMDESLARFLADAEAGLPQKLRRLCGNTTP